MIKIFIDNIITEVNKIDIRWDRKTQLYSAIYWIGTDTIWTVVTGRTVLEAIDKLNNRLIELNK